MVHHKNPHFLLVTFPAQGHINPALQFAERLLRTGAHVTFSTSVFAYRRILNNSNPPHHGLTYAPYSDGYDDGFKQSDNVEHYMSEIKRRGSETLKENLLALANERRPVTCLIYTLLLPWVADVARDLQIPSALLWIQPATVFDIYYYYFSESRDVIVNNINDPSFSIKLPGLPLLTRRDLPSFFLPSSPDAYSFVLEAFREQFQNLQPKTKPLRILVNTFDELEAEALTAIDKFNLIGVGPLVDPSVFLDDDKDSLDKNSFRCDLFDRSNDYKDWLNSKEKSSVVYISFGSIAVLTMKQMGKMARGLVDSGRPFLWIIRSNVSETKQDMQDGEEKEEYEKILSEEHNGIIVPWCSQLEVLSHSSVGCFVTHCGWNSTLESLVMGVPVVAFPQWTDQGTNAKLIEDVWKVGVRVRENEEVKIVESEEIIRCLDEVMEGKRGEEMRKNALKWKDLAREAVKQGGSSDRNLAAFVEEVGQQWF